MNKFIPTLSNNPIIAAIRSYKELKKAVKSPAKVIFILKTDIFNIKKGIELIKEHNKICAVHFDFIDGLGKNKNAVDYLFKRCKTDGIISTRSNPIKYAVSKGYCGIQRFFLIDSMSVNTAISLIKSAKPSIIEIMPGIMHNVTKEFCNKVHTPVIAGGMINNNNEIVSALSSGVQGISTSNELLWEVTIPKI